MNTLQKNSFMLKLVNNIIISNFIKFDMLNYIARNFKNNKFKKYFSIYMNN